MDVIGVMWVLVTSHALTFLTLMVAHGYTGIAMNVTLIIASSPYRNPILRMKHILGRRLRKREREPRNARVLVVAVREEWARTPRYLMTNLSGSLRRRLDAVISFLFYFFFIF